MQIHSLMLEGKDLHLCLIFDFHLKFEMMKNLIFEFGKTGRFLIESIIHCYLNQTDAGRSLIIDWLSRICFGHSFLMRLVGHILHIELFSSFFK